MAEQASNVGLVPDAKGEYSLTIRDFSAAGTVSQFVVPVPSNFNSKEATLMLRAAILKSTTWKEHPFAAVLHACMYAENYGLDIMAGDVYMPPGGRLSTTAGAKIKHAIGTGKIEGYNVTIEEGPRIKITYSTGGKQAVWEGAELTAKVTVKVKGWKEAITYEAKLSEWFVGTNPNWRDRAAYMLRKNALSKAFDEVAPMGTEADEAPPIEQPRIIPSNLPVTSIGERGSM
jgi:hypothetical protein